MSLCASSRKGLTLIPGSARHVAAADAFFALHLQNYAIPAPGGGGPCTDPRAPHAGSLRVHEGSRLVQLFGASSVCKARAAPRRWREGARETAKSSVQPLPPPTRAKGKCLSRIEVSTRADPCTDHRHAITAARSATCTRCTPAGHDGSVAFPVSRAPPCTVPADTVLRVLAPVDVISRAQAGMSVSKLNCARADARPVHIAQGRS